MGASSPPAKKARRQRKQGQAKRGAGKPSPPKKAKTNKKKQEEDADDEVGSGRRGSNSGSGSSSGGRRNLRSRDNNNDEEASTVSFSKQQQKQQDQEEEHDEPEAEDDGEDDDGEDDDGGGGKDDDSGVKGDDSKDAADIGVPPAAAPAPAPAAAKVADTRKEDEEARLRSLVEDSHKVLRCSYVERQGGWGNNKSRRAAGDASSSSSKAGLVRRLQNVVHVLQKDQTIDPDDPNQDLHHLVDLSMLLCQPTYLDDKDKDVRLNSLLACLEILGIYAPECPYDAEQLLYLFQKVVAQVGNLGHAVDPISNPHYKQYYRILELLAHVRMGVVLVELGRALDDSVELSEDPIQLLAQLFRTLLNMLQNEHPTHVHEMVHIAIVACLEEYHVHIPVPLLDEILLCLAPGPTVWALNPAVPTRFAKPPGLPSPSPGKTPPPPPPPPPSALKAPLQIELPNPSYHVAAKILRSTENHLSVSVSQLLNGLLNKEAHVTSKSSIDSSLRSPKNSSDPPDRSSTSMGRAPPPSSSPSHSAASSASWSWSTLANIIYELHRVAPRFLTSVIGTVSSGLVSHDDVHRATVVDLLGRIFVSSPHMTAHFRASYREWLERSQDVNLPIRRAMVKSLCRILAHPRGDAVHEASRALIGVLGDPALEVRQLAIYEVTDAMYRNDLSYKMAVSPELVGAVASRISSKFSEERRYAITGLGQVYFRHYVQDRLKAIQEAGNECHISLVVSTIRANCRHLGGREANRGLASGEKRRRLSTSAAAGPTSTSTPDADVFRLIPRKILEAVCVEDSLDAETRSRVVQVVDEVLLGSELSSKSNKKLTPTARAVGYVLILDSLVDQDDDDNDDDRRSGWFHEGSEPFKYVQHLFGQRAALHEALKRYLDARAAAGELEIGSTPQMAADANARELLEVAAKLTAPPRPATNRNNDVLTLIHGAKDKHIFRLLKTLVDPLQTLKTRARALADLPKRTSPFGEATSNWVRTLARRCNMGDFINSDVLEECVRLAVECFDEGDVPACSILLSAAKVTIDVFPVLGTPNEMFQALEGLTRGCGNMRSADSKQEVVETGLVAILSSILKKVSLKADLIRADVDAEFRKHLLLIGSREGTPEQANNVTYALVRLSMRTGSDAASPHPSTLTDLLKSLTSPSRLSIDESKSSHSIRTLSALAALADCAPRIFQETDEGRKAVAFALDAVLMGRGQPTEDDDDTSVEGRGSGEEDWAQATPASRKRTSPASSTSKQAKHRTPSASTSLLEDESLSYACRRICAAVEFLVSLVRASRLQQKKADPTLSISNELLQRLFGVLTQILQDEGLPPSSRDRRPCRTRQDRSALRQCCGIHLLRLFDRRLGLEVKYLTPLVSHVLGGVFLDEERAVRENVVKELVQLLEGVGAFGIEGSGEKPQSPPLRLLAFLTLCTDGDHGADHDTANGNAANIGKLAASVSKSSIDCVENLRRVCEGIYRNLRAQGKDVEVASALFDQTYKPMYLPEYVVPFAIHLLVHRSETPDSDTAAVRRSSAKDKTAENDGSPLPINRESQLRILRKRLKLVFEALVRSLGDDADNISFLLRMTETIEKQYRPVDALATHSSSIGTEGSTKRAGLLESKLQVVCRTAREVLLSLIKKDVNLTAYPGKILIPPVFRKAKQARAPVPRSEAASLGGGNESAVGSRSAGSERLLPTPSRRRGDADESFDFADLANARKVHFSPEIEVKLSAQQQVLAGDDGEVVSPIAKSRSPAPSRSSLGMEDARELSQVTIPTLDGMKSTGSSSESGTKASSVSALSSPALGPKRRSFGKAEARGPPRGPKRPSVGPDPPPVAEPPVPKHIQVRSGKSRGSKSTRSRNQGPTGPEAGHGGGANEDEDEDVQEHGVKGLDELDFEDDAAQEPGAMGLDELDFDFGGGTSATVENDPPRQGNAKRGSSLPSKLKAAPSHTVKPKGRASTATATAGRKVVVAKAVRAASRPMKSRR